MDLGRSILAGSLTMTLLVLPMIIISTQEAIRTVPDSIKQASYALGATKWQTVSRIILPYAAPGILTSTILGFSRAIGETAPLIIVGAAAYVSSIPEGPMFRFTVLPIQIYNWASRPQEESEADEALEYLKKVIAPKIKKEITCLKIGGK